MAIAISLHGATTEHQFATSHNCHFTLTVTNHDKLHFIHMPFLLQKADRHATFQELRDLKPVGIARPSIRQPMSQQSACMQQYYVINLNSQLRIPSLVQPAPSIRPQNVSGHPGHYQGAQTNRSTTGLHI
jgi:hypothetical protein